MLAFAFVKIDFYALSVKHRLIKTKRYKYFAGQVAAVEKRCTSGHKAQMLTLFFTDAAESSVLS